VSIRLQFLIVALSTLVLPWAGCQYARELESALRDSQEKSLLASADTIANALSAQPQRVFRDPDDTQAFAANRGDLYVYPLRVQPLLDGYRDDWGVEANPSSLPTTTGYRARAQAGSTERYLYLYIEVDDAHFDPEPSNARPERDRFDRVDLTLQRPDGTREFYFFGTNAPGLIAARSIVNGGDGQDRAVEESRIQAFWLQTAAGYRIEARIPLSFVGSRLWIEAEDGRGSGRAGVDAVDTPDGGRLFFTTAGLDDLLGTFIRSGTRATVIDANALKLGAAGNLSANTVDAAEQDAAPWYRRFMEMSIEARQKAAHERAELYRAHIEWALRQPGWFGGVISFHEAAKKLNAKGIPSITERSWTGGQLQKMARRLKLDHREGFFISDDALHSGVRDILSKSPLCTVDELVKDSHWPGPLGRRRVHKALRRYRAELVKGEPEYKRIGWHLDRWTEMRLRVIRLKRKHPHLFAYAIFDRLVTNPGVTLHWVRQIIHEYCLGSCEVSRRTNRYWNSRRWRLEKVARRLQSKALRVVRKT